MESSHQDAWIPTTVRGRDRRRARRQRKLTEQPNVVSGLTIWRGRSLRSQKRHARASNTYASFGARERSTENTVTDISSIHERMTSNRAGPLLRRYGWEPNKSTPKNVSLASNPRSVPQQEMPRHCAPPRWLLEAGVKWPIHFRRVSHYLNPSGMPKTLLLDYATAVAIQTVANDHSNDLPLFLAYDYSNNLLTMILANCTSVQVTIPALRNVVEWINLHLFKRFVDRTPFSVACLTELLRRCVYNTHHGVEIIEFLMKEHGSVIGDQILNDILEEAFNAVQSKQRSLRRKQRPSLAPDKHSIARLCETLIASHDTLDISAVTTTALMNAEARIAGDYEYPEPWECTEWLINRCIDGHNVTSLFEKAMEKCSLTTVKLLFRRWQMAPVNKECIRLFFQRNGYLSSADRPINSRRDADELYVLRELARRWEGSSFEEVVLIHHLIYHEGPRVMDKLRAVSVTTTFSQLLTRLTLCAFSLEELRLYLPVHDTAWNVTNLKAVMEMRVALPERSMRGKKPLIRLLAMRVPPHQLSIDVIHLAARTTPFRLFREILDRSEILEVPSSVLLSIMRSPYAAMRKVTYLFARWSFCERHFDVNFWPALICNNHRDTVTVMNFLCRRLRIRTSNAMIVAALRTDQASRLVRLLRKDRSFMVSRSTISAVLQEESWLHNRPHVLKDLLRHSGLSIDGELIAESFSVKRAYRILLRKHGAPDKLHIPERIMLGQLNGSRGNFFGSRCLKDYISAGGNVSATKKVLESIAHRELPLSIQLWRAQTAVDFHTMVNVCQKVRTPSQTRVYDDTENTILDFLLEDGPPKLNEEILQVFDIRESRVFRERCQFEGFWEVMSDLILGGDRSRFERLYARLGELTMPSSMIERLCARTVAKRNALSESTESNKDLEPSDIFDYVNYYFGGVTLSTKFFQAVRDEHRPSARDSWPVLSLQHWMALFNSSIEIEWAVEAEEALFAMEPFEIVIKVRMWMKKDFKFTEKAAIAAISSPSALMKLEFMWRDNCEMVATAPMIEAAARTTVVEVLDFLMARAEAPRVSEAMIVKAIQGLKPGARRNNYTDRRNRTHMVECLIAQAEDLNLAHSTLELAVRGLEETAAEKLLRLSNNIVTKGVLLAMVDANWQLERIRRNLRTSIDNLHHLNDEEVVQHLLQTACGRSMLLLLESHQAPIRTLVEKKLRDAAAKNSSWADWAILDYLHEATEIHLSDEDLAHLWEQSTTTVYDNNQILLLALESGATGQIGPKTFSMFGRICNHSLRSGSSRVTGMLPPLPVDITDELISAARSPNYSDGRIAMDYILGPDHVVTVHESALQQCARVGEELWLYRLLSRMSGEQIAVIDLAALLKAAREGGNSSIIAFCRSLLGQLPPQKSARQVLSRLHYAMRQRQKHCRPRAVSPLSTLYRTHRMRNINMSPKRPSHPSAHRGVVLEHSSLLHQLRRRIKTPKLLKKVGQYAVTRVRRALYFMCKTKRQLQKG